MVRFPSCEASTTRGRGPGQRARKTTAQQVRPSRPYASDERDRTSRATNDVAPGVYEVRWALSTSARVELSTSTPLRKDSIVREVMSRVTAVEPEPRSNRARSSGRPVPGSHSRRMMDPPISAGHPGQKVGAN
jgi:hypothetical protein